MFLKISFSSNILCEISRTQFGVVNTTSYGSRNYSGVIKRIFNRVPVTHTSSDKSLCVYPTDSPTNKNKFNSDKISRFLQTKL